MKTVNETELLKRLNAARVGTQEEQKAFLQSLKNLEQSVVLDILLGDDDLNWLVPLARELFMPATTLVFEGMRRKCQLWEEEFLDEETNEVIPFLRCDVIENETVFTPNKAFMEQVRNDIKAKVHEIDIEQLRILRWADPEIEGFVDDELYRRDDPGAIERRGDLYRWGNEENGVFINYATAKQYYDRAGVEFDPEEETRENRHNATESFPDFATYHIEGAGVLTVKQLLNLLNERLGEHDEPYMYLPLEALIKVLVGSDAYIGYIQTIDEVEGKPDAIELEVEFYGCRPDCLKYALEYGLQPLFPELKVEFTEHDP